MVEVSQRAGLPVEVYTFLGSSPIRALAEQVGPLRACFKKSAEAIDVGVKAGLPVCYVTEDTVRSKPEVLATLFKNAVDHGATRLCLCDTVGHATPDGVRNLIVFAKSVVAAMGCGHVKIDWHGHNDRGLGLVNGLIAIEHGADRVHGTALGIGERVGNTAMDSVLLNLKLAGAPGRSGSVQLAEVLSDRFESNGLCRAGVLPACRRRRVQNVDGSSCVGHYQSRSEGRRVARRSNLFRCSRRHVWPQTRD